MMIQKNKIKLLLSLLLVISISFIISSCGNTKFDKSKFGNCSDGIANQNEEGVDCGGNCLPCSSCSDGIKNGSETGIDCGGACISCSPQCTLTSGTLEYTIFPQEFPNGYSNTQTTYGSGYYSTSGSEIRIDFSNGTLSSFIILALIPLIAHRFP